VLAQKSRSSLPGGSQVIGGECVASREIGGLLCGTATSRRSKLAGGKVAGTAAATAIASGSCSKQSV
jgi:hypothetical protein